jgi:hypothetical protein
MDIFNEILWPQFVQLNEVRSLPLNEQVKKYNQYIGLVVYLDMQNYLDLNLHSLDSGSKSTHYL